MDRLGVHNGGRSRVSLDELDGLVGQGYLAPSDQRDSWFTDVLFSQVRGSQGGRHRPGFQPGVWAASLPGISGSLKAPGQALLKTR